MYPGSLWILQAGVSTALLDGRSKLVEEKKGKRYKLKSETNNSVDCMFMDRRNDPRYPNGNVLVISCEGNAGFYEIGSTITPMDAGTLYYRSFYVWRSCDQQILDLFQYTCCFLEKFKKGHKIMLYSNSNVKISLNTNFLLCQSN